MEVEMDKVIDVVWVESEAAHRSWGAEIRKRLNSLGVDGNFNVFLTRDAAEEHMRDSDNSLLVVIDPYLPNNESDWVNSLVNRSAGLQILQWFVGRSNRNKVRCIVFSAILSNDPEAPFRQLLCKDELYIEKTVTKEEFLSQVMQIYEVPARG
jgi:hypothetical protein